MFCVASTVNPKNLKTTKRMTTKLTQLAVRDLVSLSVVTQNASRFVATETSRKETIMEGNVDKEPSKTALSNFRPKQANK